MATTVEILEALGRQAPFDKAAGWDPVGLQLGDMSSVVEKAAVCHEVTEAVVDAVEDDRPQLLVTYHPLLFRPTRSIVAGRSAEGRAFRLLGAGIALGVVHTAFDVAPGGAADALADELGLVDVSGFGPLWGPDSVKVVTFLPADAVEEVAGAMAAAGGGAIGNYRGCSFRAEGVGAFFAGEGTSPATGRADAANAEPELRLEMNAPAARLNAVTAAMAQAHPYEEPAYDVYDRRGDAAMLGRVGSLPGPMKLGELSELVDERVAGTHRVAGDRSARIERVGLIPGSGTEFIAEAATAGADVLITGDVAHHHAVRALDHGISIIDAGHAATELPGARRLYAAVAAVAEASDLTGDGSGPWS